MNSEGTLAFNMNHFSSWRCGDALGDGYLLGDLTWPSSRLDGKSENQLGGTELLSHLPPHILQAHNLSRPVPISQTGSNVVSRVSRKVISMTRASAVNAWGLGLNISQTQGKNRLKILVSSSLLKQKAEVGRVGLWASTRDLLLLLTVPGSLRVSAQFSKFSSV